MKNVDARSHSKEKDEVGDFQIEEVEENLELAPVLKSKALRWNMPVIGEVPISK